MLEPEFPYQGSLFEDTLRYMASPALRQQDMSGGYRRRLKSSESEQSKWDSYRVRFADGGVHLSPHSEIPNPWWVDAAGQRGGPVSQVHLNPDELEHIRKLDKSHLELSWGFTDIDRADTYTGVYYDPVDPAESMAYGARDVVDTGNVSAVSRRFIEERKELLDHMQNVLSMTNELVPCIKMLCSGLGELAGKEGAFNKSLTPAQRHIWQRAWKKDVKGRQLKKELFCKEMDEAILEVQWHIQLWKRGLGGAWPSLSDALPPECFDD